MEVLAELKQNLLIHLQQIHFKAYPKDKLIDASSDYVVFEFVKYNPPFGRDSQTNQQRYTYNAGVTNDALEKVKVQIDDGIDTLVLPMPQDLSNEMKQNWEGKSFSGLGKSVTCRW